MIIGNWKPLLQQLSKFLLKNKEIGLVLEAQGRLPNARKNQWLGFSPANNLTLDALETKLDRRLPSSYRTFLQTTDGFGPLNAFIPCLLPASKVGRFSESDPEFIAPWIEDMDDFPDMPDENYLVYGPDQDVCDIRRRYLPNCVKVSELGDRAVILLNPEIQTEDGEWEAWFFASWFPGARRYRSFADLMQAQLETARNHQPEAGKDGPIQSMPRPLGKASDEPFK